MQTFKSAGDFGYLAHKGNTQGNRGSTFRITSRDSEYKVNDLKFEGDNLSTRK